MILFPAIDIRNGRCVRLVQGDYDKEDFYGDPVYMAKRWEDAGAQYLHIVDLDGALEGASKNLSVIARIADTVKLPIQVGGGIRSMVQVEKLLDIGIERVILGSAAVYDESFLNSVLEKYGSTVAVSIDAMNGLVATDGWTKITSIKALDYARNLEGKGLKTIVYTDIEKDGMLSGPNFAEIDIMNQQTNMQVIAAGGVTSLEDIRKLQRLNIYGAIIGKALYTGEIDFQSALQEVTK
ncbi:MAG: 1-(5-phosphoribosyl)-5-[(5-phosphoribosylamino)methylideneamino]imidazole-4-carboxamide isomerase [Firmicutes bacterium]|mgnify:CR=1 FL=1|nr:1-(5-phosphoribosyl)-5-[(5-phosphoribosylamino)methylideneamino]imidazole-4-carboxamide isomerase [Bacillota bacterium]